MTDKKTTTAALLIIGDEILSGRTKDANLNHLAVWLGERGIQLKEARVIPDEEDIIVSAVNHCRAEFYYVFTTGGIGPTHDDITASCVAKAFGVPFGYHDEALRILTDYYGEQDLTDARKRMAMIPEGGILIDNPVSRAPGFQMDNVFVMAGIPKVMQAMLRDIEPRLEGGDKVLSRAIYVYRGEGWFSALLEQVQNQFSGLSIGSYPFMNKGVFGATFVLRSQHEDVLEQALKLLQQGIEASGEEWHEGEPEKDPRWSGSPMNN